MKKKITRKELKQPDEFISVAQKALLFVSHHSRKVAAGGVVVLVILLALFLFQKWEKSKNEGAYRKFSLALQAYQVEGQKSEYKNALAKFDEVIAESPRTFWGKLALLYKGNAHLQMGAFEEAIGAYNSFLQKAGKEKIYRLFALEGLGYAYEGRRITRRRSKPIRRSSGRGKASSWRMPL
jgi:tetratricopeptide (TPR) repeat protein